MPETNTCVCCGRIIPEGTQICLQCGSYDDQQRFEQKSDLTNKETLIRRMIDSEVTRIRRIIDSEVTEFVWQYVCSKKQSCPAGSCTECVMNWLRANETKELK